MHACHVLAVQVSHQGIDCYILGGDDVVDAEVACHSDIVGVVAHKCQAVLDSEVLGVAGRDDVELVVVCKAQKQVVVPEVFLLEDSLVGDVCVKNQDSGIHCGHLLADLSILVDDRYVPMLVNRNRPEEEVRHLCGSDYGYALGFHRPAADGGEELLDAFLMGYQAQGIACPDYGVSAGNQGFTVPVQGGYDEVGIDLVSELDDRLVGIGGVLLDIHVVEKKRGVLEGYDIAVDSALYILIDCLCDFLCRVHDMSDSHQGGPDSAVARVGEVPD